MVKVRGPAERRRVAVRVYTSDSLLQRIIQAPEAFFPPQSGQSLCNIGRDPVSRQGRTHGGADLAEADGLFLGKDLELGLEGEDVPTCKQCESVAHAADALACAICHAHIAPLTEKLGQMNYQTRTSRGRTRLRAGRLLG